jgi:hypothetical protein
MHDAYTAAGGRAELRMFPPVLHDGHRLFADYSARKQWLRRLDLFFDVHGMPNDNRARVEKLMSATKLPIGARQIVQEYFSTPIPKFLVVTASRAGAYWVANPTDIEGARSRTLTRCREESGVECSVLVENNEFVRPTATGATTSAVTVR